MGIKFIVAHEYMDGSKFENWVRQDLCGNDNKATKITMVAIKSFLTFAAVMLVGFPLFFVGSPLIGAIALSAAIAMTIATLILASQPRSTLKKLDDEIQSFGNKIST